MRSRAAIRLASKALVAALSVVASGACVAQSPAQALLDSRLVFSLGAFAVGTDVKASLDGSVQTDNDEIDFDETFGLGKAATRWRLDALWRITPRHHLRFSYFDYSSSATETLDQAVEWGDYTFTAGGKVKADFSTEVYVLSYEFAFIREPSYELAAQVGVHYSDISLKLSGDATLTDENGNVVDQGVVSKAGNVPAPLPMIGLRGSWAASPHWLLDASGALFSARYDVFAGSWFHARLGATWMYNERFGIGTAYSYFRSNFDVGKDSFNGSLATNYSGLQVFVTGTF